MLLVHFEPFYTAFWEAPSSQACDWLEKGHGLVLLSQMVPRESGVNAMAGGYFTAHWNQISNDRAQWQLSFQPARMGNPFSPQGDKRINTFFFGE